MPEWMQGWWPIVGPVFALVCAAFAGWVSWSIRTRFASKEDLEKAAAGLAEQISAERRAREAADEAARAQRVQVDHRLTEIEAQLQHLPSAEDVHELKVQLTRVEGLVGTVQTRLDGVQGLLERVEAAVRTHQSILTDAARNTR